MSILGRARNLLLTRQATLTLRLLAALIVVGAFVLVFIGQADTLRAEEWRVSWAFLFLAALAAVSRGPVIPYPWWRIVAGWGYAIPPRRSLRIYFHSGLARYVPGQWWFVAGRAYLAEREGVPAAATVAATALETVSLTGTAFLIGLLGLATVPSGGVFDWTWLLAAGLLGAVLLPLAPALLTRLTNRLLHFARRERLPSALSMRDAFLVLAGCVINWVLYGLVATFLLAGLSGGGYLAYAPATVGIFAASVLGGSILLFIPQGIIVREGLLVYLLHTLLGVPLAVGIGVAALTRLFSMGAEGLWAAVAIRDR